MGEGLRCVEAVEESLVVVAVLHSRQTWRPAVGSIARGCVPVGRLLYAYLTHESSIR